MSGDNSVFIPPVTLFKYEEFRQFAKDAALVVCTPEYFRSPFLDDDKRLKRVTLTAVGVNVRGLPLSFKYVLDFDDFHDPSKTWDEESADVTRLMSELVDEIGAASTLVQGRVETEASLGEVLSRP